MTNNVKDFHAFKSMKKAQTYKKHLDMILYIFTLSEKSLTPFSGYKSVQSVLDVIKKEKAILQLHYEKIEQMKKLYEGSDET